jgi:hypothetical protein
MRHVYSGSREWTLIQGPCRLAPNNVVIIKGSLGGEIGFSSRFSTKEALLLYSKRETSK